MRLWQVYRERSRADAFRMCVRLALARAVCGRVVFVCVSFPRAMPVSVWRRTAQVQRGPAHSRFADWRSFVNSVAVLRIFPRYRDFFQNVIFLLKFFLFRFFVLRCVHFRILKRFDSFEFFFYIKILWKKSWKFALGIWLIFIFVFWFCSFFFFNSCTDVNFFYKFYNENNDY